MLTVIQTHQQQMSLGAKCLTSSQNEEEISSGKKMHPRHSYEPPPPKRHKEATSGIFTNQRLTRKSEGKAKILQKCKKKTGHSSKQESLFTSSIEVVTHI